MIRNQYNRCKNAQQKTCHQSRYAQMASVAIVVVILCATCRCCHFLQGCCVVGFRQEAHVQGAGVVPLPSMNFFYIELNGHISFFASEHKPCAWQVPRPVCV